MIYRWTIKARVTNKSTIRTWSNAKGDGKLFSVNLLDETGEIKATAFNDQVDKYYDMLEDNRVLVFHFNFLYIIHRFIIFLKQL